MATAAAQRADQRLVGQRQEMRRLVPRQGQIEGKGQRRVERQQLAITAHLQCAQPGRFLARGLPVVAMRGRRMSIMAGMLVMLAHRHRSRLRRLYRRVQRTDMNHQHGEQAKPDAQCRKPFVLHH